jgi:hypothetical protein
MSLMDKLRSQVTQMLRGSKEARVMQLARGVDNPFKVGAPSDVLASYGDNGMGDYLRTEFDLLGRFIDYEAMDEYPLVSNALDIWAADSTQPDTPTNRRVWVDSPDRDVKQVLNDLLHRTLRVEDRLSGIVRTLCGTGNAYTELVTSTDGVLDLIQLPTVTMRRVEGPKGELYGFVQDFKRRIGYMPQDWSTLMRDYEQRPAHHNANPYSVIGADEAIPFESWQVAHWKLDRKGTNTVYGYPVIEPARWAWKRLVMMEDSALIYKLQRAPERYAFYVNVGNRSPQEAMRLVNMVRQQFKKTKFINRENNQVDMRFDVLSPTEDFFIPSFNGTDSTRIEVLGAPAFQSVEDVSYFRDMMTAALQIPKAYQGFEEGATKAILSSEDVRFARSILNIQREIRKGITKICEVHLAAVGIPPSRVDFDTYMTVPSAIFELAQMEVRNARADLALRLKDVMSQKWILRTVYGMNDQEIEDVIRERGEDFKRDASIQAEAQAGADALMGLDAAEESRFQPGVLQGKFTGAKNQGDVFGPRDRRILTRLDEKMRTVEAMTTKQSHHIRTVQQSLHAFRNAQRLLKEARSPANPSSSH